VSRRTATRYIEAAKELGLVLDSELTDEAVRRVAGEVQERPAPEPSEKCGRCSTSSAFVSSTGSSMI
jgi:hypothetical protein